jgi:hypothetical protein
MDSMLEKIAALQHEIWSHWMKYLFEVSIHNDDGSVTIPSDKVERWVRQINTNYEDLPVEEQAGDLEQAVKVVSELESKSQDF